MLGEFWLTNQISEFFQVGVFNYSVAVWGHWHFHVEIREVRPRQDLSYHTSSAYVNET